MKILFFIESLEAGGKERRLVELIYSLSCSNLAQCEIILFRDQVHYTKIFKTNTKIHILPRTGRFSVAIFFQFFKIVRCMRPALIHVWGALAATYAIPTKLLLGLPLVNSQITDVPFTIKNPLLVRCNFRFSDLILANSYAGLKRYNADQQKGKVIYNGFDFTRIQSLNDPEGIRQKFGIETPFVVGMVATFSESKDYHTYLNAAISITNVRNDVTFLCIGSGNDEIFKKYIPANNFRGIRFLGAQDDVESIMNICDIGVLTSYGEGISNALLEFMALGKPVIATSLGGTPELIEDDVNGYLINRSDFSSLRKYISELIQDGDKRMKMGFQNRKKVQEKFSIKAMTDGFFSQYKTLV